MYQWSSLGLAPKRHASCHRLYAVSVLRSRLDKFKLKKTNTRAAWSVGFASAETGMYGVFRGSHIQGICLTHNVPSGEYSRSRSDALNENLKITQLKQKNDF
jgi:hypothetical protein